MLGLTREGPCDGYKKANCDQVDPFDYEMKSSTSLSAIHGECAHWFPTSMYHVFSPGWTVLFPSNVANHLVAFRYLLYVSYS
jgi:hypothetical protein